MKPIEKYKQKFIDLLKEAEELGGELKVEVSSSMAPMPSLSSTTAWPPEPTKYEKVYDFSIATNEKKQAFWIG